MHPAKLVQKKPPQCLAPLHNNHWPWLYYMMNIHSTTRYQGGAVDVPLKSLCMISLHKVSMTETNGEEICPHTHPRSSKRPLLLMFLKYNLLYIIPFPTLTSCFSNSVAKRYTKVTLFTTAKATKLTSLDQRKPAKFSSCTITKNLRE